jgi:hypothetical protein
MRGRGCGAAQQAVADGGPQRADATARLVCDAGLPGQVLLPGLDEQAGTAAGGYLAADEGMHWDHLAFGVDVLARRYGGLESVTMKDWPRKDSHC